MGRRRRRHVDHTARFGVLPGACRELQHCLADEVLGLRSVRTWLPAVAACDPQQDSRRKNATPPHYVASCFALHARPSVAVRRQHHPMPHSMPDTH